ncbi:uncharacterized protein GGS22DRAFT_108056 [Annulohypoxylon maeteangense]|uniref:uncharacterized protein n=1 Tax=Annulohypoxylon maeteangense TaxID=1927788 RepID=UPI0020081493|nr:uncharacterized protein GGS22DRAFT_108056 [Annulohypoxylon maeteangense]KAI0887346.1 hypothetical protein GGS22DRAFT_108056 [Annulohypoxylon maeteangense]
MKFSSIFSVFLAGLAVASPLGKPQSSEDLAVREAEIEIESNLITRADDKISAEYNKVHAAKSSIANGKYYAFTVKWPLGDGTNIDSETPAEIQELQKKLGFKHVGVIIGKVKDVETGKGKNKHHEKDFSGQLFHLIKKADGSAQLDSPRNYKLSGQTAGLFKNGQLSFLKEVSAKTFSDAKKTADKYFAVPGHDKYSVDNNNCDSFAKTFAAEL